MTGQNDKSDLGLVEIFASGNLVDELGLSEVFYSPEREFFCPYREICPLYESFHMLSAKSKNGRFMRMVCDGTQKEQLYLDCEYFSKHYADDNGLTDL